MCSPGVLPHVAQFMLRFSRHGLLVEPASEKTTTTTTISVAILAQVRGYCPTAISACLGICPGDIWYERKRFSPILQVSLSLLNSMWVRAVLWMALCEAVGSEPGWAAADSMVPLKEQAGLAYTTIEHCGNSGDVFFIDCSMQFGYLVDVGLFLPAACLLAAFSCVLPACGAAPSPCGLALSAELWPYSGICFQSWIVDVDFDGLCLILCGWSRFVGDESCLGPMTSCGAFLWIVSPCGLMALISSCCSYCEDLSLMALKDECSPGYGVLEFLMALLQGCCSHGVIFGFMAYFVGSSVAAAIALLYFSKKMKQHAAAAGAAAIEGMRVSESLLTSAAVALKYFKGKKAQQAAAAAGSCVCCLLQCD